MLWQLLPAASDAAVTTQPATSENYISILSDKTFVQFVLISVIFLSCFVQLFTNLPVYLKKDVHLAENYIGFLSSWNGIMIVLMEMTVIFWMERNWSKKRAVTIGVALHIIAYLFASLLQLSLAGAFVLMTFITLSEMLSFSVLTNFWMSRTDETNRGQYAAIWTMTWAFAQTVGPFLGSLVAQYAGFSVLWAVVALLSGMAMLLYAKVMTN